ncbi:MAG: hypothetical protein SFZ02_19300 [bacterium]|nr:hypothetical protein [bacterium]
MMPIVTVVFHPNGKPTEKMRLDVEGESRVVVMNVWRETVIREGYRPEDFTVLGVDGLPNKYQRRIEAEEERRHNS